MMRPSQALQEEDVAGKEITNIWKTWLSFLGLTFLNCKKTVIIIILVIKHQIKSFYIWKPLDLHTPTPGPASSVGTR